MLDDAAGLWEFFAGGYGFLGVVPVLHFRIISSFNELSFFVFLLYFRFIINPTNITKKLPPPVGGGFVQRLRL